MPTFEAVKISLLIQPFHVLADPSAMRVCKSSSNIAAANEDVVAKAVKIMESEHVESEQWPSSTYPCDTWPDLASRL